MPASEREALARIDREIEEIRSFDGPCWLKALGEADWEAERFLIERESKHETESRML